VRISFDGDSDQIRLEDGKWTVAIRSFSKFILFLNEIGHLNNAIGRETSFSIGIGFRVP
jgi:hypothetical protein